MKALLDWLFPWRVAKREMRRAREELLELNDALELLIGSLERHRDA